MVITLRGDKAMQAPYPAHHDPLPIELRRKMSDVLELRPPGV
jgi:hypothetical protein